MVECESLYIFVHLLGKKEQICSDTTLLNPTTLEIGEKMWFRAFFLKIHATSDSQSR